MSYFDAHPLGRGMIRLIHVLPRNCEAESMGKTNRSSGRPEQPQITCTIDKVSLNDRPNYTALSYTWGDASRSQQIIINDAVVPVTESVETALRHLQRDTEVLTLWVDQLCINQNNYLERNEQVQQMNAIYSKAAQVLVWLGPAADDSDHVMDLLEWLGREAYNFGVMQLNMSDYMSLYDPKADERLLSIKTSIHELVQKVGSSFPVNSYRSLVEREWWLRVWVVQEISLAPDVIFACGKKRLPYQHFIAADAFFTLYVLGMVNSLSLGDILDNPRIKPLLEAPISSAASSMLSTRRKYQGEIDGNRHDYSLYRLLIKSHVIASTGYRLKATDPRDKIFGLLGLANDAKSLNISINYDNPCCKVYADAARRLIQTGNIDILALCQYPKILIDLPSWAPDWSALIRPPCGDCSRLGNPEESFSASAQLSAKLSVPDNLEISQMGLRRLG
jgi:hypothetical protein